MNNFRNTILFVLSIMAAARKRQQKQLAEKNIPQQKQQQQRTDGRQFEHGIQVFIKGGFEKGAMGFVTGFFPGYYSVEIEPEQTITQTFPETVIVTLANGPGTKIVVSSHVDRFVVLKSNQIARLIGPIDRDQPDRFAIRLTDAKSMDDLAQRLSTRQIQFAGDNTVVDVEEIADYFDVILEYTGMSAETLTDLPYNYGKITKTNEAQTQTHKVSAKVIRLKTNQIRKIGNEIIITKGPYASERLYNNFEQIPAYLSIELMSNARTITTNLYNLGTVEEPKYITRYITSKDVFYFDLRVKLNGSTFDAQVISVNPDGTFNAEVVLENGSLEKINGIHRNQIQSLGQGFKWTSDFETEHEEQKFEPEERFEQFEPEQEEQFEDRDENAEFEENEAAESEAGEELGEAGEEFGEARELGEAEREEQVTSSYQDLSRMNQSETILTDDQKSFKSMITTILRRSDINENAIDIYKSSVLADKISKDLQRELEMMISSTRAINYIVASLVFIELIQNGYRLVDRSFGLARFTQKLIDTKFLKETDSSDILLKEQISGNEKIQAMMKNAFEIVKNKTGSMAIPEPTETEMPELIPLGLKRKLVPEQSREEIKAISKRYMITAKQILNGESFPENEVPILWGANKIIEKFKNELRKLYDSTKDPDYNFMIENFERGPYAIREIENPEHRDYFQHVYDLFIEALRKESTRKTRQAQKLEQEKQTIEETRKKLAETNLQPMDETPVEIPNTNAYIKEQRLREQREQIARLTRKIRNLKTE